MRITKILLANLLLGMLFTAAAQQAEPAHEGAIRSMQFSASGNFLITGGEDRMIRLWDVKTGKMLYAQKIPFLPLKFYISPDENYAVVTQNAGKNVLFYFRTGKKITDLPVEEIKGFSPDSKSLIVVDYAYEGTERYALLGYANPHDAFFVSYFSYSPLFLEKGLKDPVISEDGKKIFLPDGADGIFVFNKDTLEQERKITNVGETDVMALLPLDTAFVRNGSDSIYCFGAKTSEAFLAEATFPEASAKLYVSDSKIVNQSGNKVKVFDLETGAITYKGEYPGAVLCAVSPQGNFAAYTKDGSTLWCIPLREEAEAKAFSATDIQEKVAFQYYLKGVYFLNKMQFAHAKTYFDQAENKTDRAKKLYYLRGEALLKSGFYEEAIKNFLIDNALHPGQASLEIAKSFAGLKDASMAAQWLDSCQKYKIPLDPVSLLDSTVFRPVQGNAYFRNKVHALCSEEAQLLVEESRRRIKNNELLAGLEFLNKAIVVEPENAGWYRERAKLYLKLKEYEKARMDYLKTADLNHYKKGVLYLNVALTYSKTGDFTKTITWIKKAIQVDSSLVNSMIDIAEIYQANYHRDSALFTLNAYLHLVPIDHYAIYLRASMMPMQDVALKEMQRAIAFCEEQGEIVPREYTDFLASLSPTTRR